MYDIDDLINELLNSRDNDLCLCGSGKLFKYCHKLIIYKKKENKAKLFAEYIKTKNKKQCLFGNGNNCDNEIVKAHSISKKYLRNIVDSTNHVYSFIPNIKDKTKMDELYFNRILPDPVKIGIQDVTTFYGLCKIHDDELFKCFEKYNFTCSIEQLKALHLRAVLKEIYVKNEAILTTDKAQKSIGKISEGISAFEKNVHCVINAYGANLSMKDLDKERDLIINAILSQSNDEFIFLCYEVEGKCPVLCSSIPNPAFDFKENMIQNYNDKSAFIRSFSFNILAEPERYYFIFSWFNCEVIDIFFRSFLERFEDILQGLVQMAFAFSENLAINIDWFDSLSPIKRQRLIKIFYSNCLGYNTDEDASREFRKLRFVDGKVIKVFSNTPYFD